MPLLRLGFRIICADVAFFPFPARLKKVFTIMPDGKRKVIILEDDDDISALFCQLLSSYGAEPILCQNQQTALAAADDPAVAMALLDIMLPDTDGRNVAASLREKNVDFPVYFMTGIRESSIGEQHLSLARGVLKKPFAIKELRAILDRELTQSSEPDRSAGLDREMLELMTSVATEQESLRRQQRQLQGLMHTVEEHLTSDASTSAREQFREFCMGLEAALCRIDERLGQIRALLKESK